MKLLISENILQSLLQKRMELLSLFKVRREMLGLTKNGMSISSGRTNATVGYT